MGARRQKQLLIEDYEIALIKGIIRDTDYNDQEIVSMFSHLSRNINHREIGYFKAESDNPKYKDYASASPAQVSAFLNKYDKFEPITKFYGLQPKEPYFDLVHKASEAMKNAVAIYNNPSLRWKTETYIVNAVIAWTYLMHAYFITQGIDYTYKHSDGQPRLTEEGRPKLWELTKCLKDSTKCRLPKAVVANLRYLIAIRNEIEHSMCENLDVYIGGKLQACSLNFNQWMCYWFGNSYSIADDMLFSIQFSELSLQSNSEIVGNKGLPSVIETVNKSIEKDLSSDEYNDPQYSYRVFVVPRTINNRKTADQAVTYAPMGSPVEMAVREVERPKYSAGDIVDLMRGEGYADFSTHGKGGFVEFWKSIDGKNPSKGLGVYVVGNWVWYENMVDAVRVELMGRQKKTD